LTEAASMGTICSKGVGGDDEDQHERPSGDGQEARPPEIGIGDPSPRGGGQRGSVDEARQVQMSHMSSAHKGQEAFLPLCHRLRLG
jgi:hypothetical protein